MKKYPIWASEIYGCVKIVQNRAESGFSSEKFLVKCSFFRKFAAQKNFIASLPAIACHCAYHPRNFLGQMQDFL